MTHWCILRTAGRSTLALTSSLAADGFDVWTPCRAMKIRKPRWNAHRDVTVPLTASWVFAGAHHLVDLLNLAEQASQHRRGAGCRLPAHPDFSVFHHLDRIPLIADRDLDPLREEANAAPRSLELRDIYRKGDRVRVTSGIFGDMAGYVERPEGILTLVRFGAKLRVKLSTFILKPDLMNKHGVARANQIGH
jgi:hypothetical protein